MTKFIGRIQEIYTEKVFKTHTNRHIEKEVVILKMEQNQHISVQFQGEQRKLLEGYRENQEVIIEGIFNGQRTSKRFYDNIIGKSIVKFN